MLKALQRLFPCMMASPSSSSSSSASSPAGPLPRVLVFDLDNCVWSPEMYELWGSGGAPFTPTKDGNLKDRSGERVFLMGDVRNIFRELATLDRWKDTRVAIASRCDEPSWAAECIKKFSVGEGILLDQVFDGPREIHKGCKTTHLKNIAKKTGVPLQDMIFFDDQYGNCRDVAELGVTVAYTPNGVTRQIFQEALGKFPSPGKILGPKHRGSLYH